MKSIVISKSFFDCSAPANWNQSTAGFRRSCRALGFPVSRGRVLHTITYNLLVNSSYHINPHLRTPFAMHFPPKATPDEHPRRASQTSQPRPGPKVSTIVPLEIVARLLKALCLPIFPPREILAGQSFLHAFSPLWVSVLAQRFCICPPVRELLAQRVLLVVWLDRRAGGLV